MKRSKKRPYLKASFIVTFHRPPKATVDDMRTYISDAVQGWRGQLQPPEGDEDRPDGDPMWALDPDTVVVRSHNVRKTQGERS
jgi:hypothetical protein